ncbi:MAG: DNA mismatch repair endonuclease MutL [Endomicrobia bacterium]|nr:DNA mismatch repair endonuclease MutL [Endomicrobiia bacterium]
MNKIKLLPPEVYTRIAAGEVIERPSNVVKELIENSIDASSTEISIEIVSSGKKLIRVIDNGSGMTKDDLMLSIKPHATSKIESFDDIYKLSTLGFRGEALSSIVNVSKTTIITKTADSLVGYKLIIHGGETIDITECAANNGTMVEVKDLFYNVPARLKFLKTDYTEKIHIIRTIEEYTIAFPNIGFNLYSDNELVFSVKPSNEIQDRIKEVIKKDLSDNLISFHYKTNEMSIFGFVSPVEYSQVNKTLQLFFVNNRPVISRMLSQTLYDAYRDMLPTGRHPVGIIFIEIPSNMVDVNVHPTKRVIKFNDEEYIYNILKEQVRKSINNYYKQVVINIKHTQHVSSSFESQDILISNKKIQQKGTIEQTMELTLQQEKSAGDLKNIGLKDYVYLGQLHRTYLLFETSEGLVMMDQHAASERILFEKFMNAEKISIQKLLFPVNLELSSSDFEAIKPYVEEINKLGFEITVTGKTSIGFYSIPSIFNVTDVRDYVAKFVELLLDDIKTEMETITPKERIIRSACRAAIKANELLTLSEVNKLLLDIAKCEQPFFCPHGRPTIVKFDFDKIEKMFMRKK